MKERLLTLALAGGALALFYLLFIPKPTPDREKITQPLSAERGPNGYAAMVRWFEVENFPQLSFRERYQRLPQVADGAGHLLITTLPHRLTARPTELIALKDWLREGNTLLVMAALADTPDWAMQSSLANDLLSQLHELTGIKFVVGTKADEDSDQEKKPERAGQSRSVADAFARLLEPQRHTMQPIGKHPLTEGVHTVAAVSEYPAGDWIGEPDAVGAVLELARESESQLSPREPVMWLATIGKGKIIVSGFGSPFTNKLLGEADNAQLLANVVRWSLGPKGHIVIDDAHQGSVAFYDPAAFYGDERLHRTLIWLVVLWLVFVLGPVRLRPAAAHWNPVDLTSFIRATGGFLARTVKPAEAGRRALILFFDRVRRRLGMPEDGKPVWEWLAGQPQIAPHDLSELRAYHARIVAGKRIDLVKLKNLLHRLTEGFV